ncbi:MAG: DUF1851 domain-containing protein [Eubacterium sp.]|nr:DUF1851 domain-containing protein [Eubacterium sp.]
MFDEFLKYTNSDVVMEEIKDDNQFLKKMFGKSFFNGMYRLFETTDIEKWNDIVEKTFGQYKGKINVFGYDWLGRIFAVNKQTNTILLFEPGAGTVLNIPVGIEEFHNVEIVEYNEDCLASRAFREWMEKNNYVLKNNECAGYKVPLFLNGDDVIENMEVSDMEVYWEIMMPLVNL